MTNLERIQAHKQDVNKNGKLSIPITQEILDDMIKRGSGTYTSGRERKVGDWLLFGFLNNPKNPDITISLITLHEEEYGTVYEDDPFMSDRRSTIMLELIKK